MFRKLSTRLTVLYAALFGAVLLTVSLAVYLAISGAAERQVRSELAATGTVFDRVWSLRSERLQEGASLLSRDFGFREAAAGFAILGSLLAIMVPVLAREMQASRVTEAMEGVTRIGTERPRTTANTSWPCAACGAAMA